MKTTNLMIVGGALLMIISCDNNQRNNERNQAKDDLKSFVDSVERVADERTGHNWTELDRRFTALEQRAQTAYRNADDRDMEDLREIEADYQEAKIEGKKKEVEMTQTSQMHIERVESWREERGTTAAGTGTRGTTTQPNRRDNNDMDDTVQESVDWLEDNFDQLGNDIRTRYERIRADVSTNNNTTRPGTNPGGTAPAGTNQGGTIQGGANQGGVNQGGAATQGGANQRGTTQGGANQQGGTTQGGANQGGTNQSGNVQGGTNPGGTNRN
jgi:hypothetical protein